MNLKKLTPVFIFLSLLTLPSCFKDNKEEDYSQWRELNTRYFDSLADLTINGQYAYTAITPTWDKSFSILMQWHNDEDNSQNLITPLSTSTCHVKYTLTNIAGDTLDSSASLTCVPNNMVTGFMAALMNMHVNDTVTAVLPYSAGYGAYGSGAILPYSTLTFGIRLDSISKLM